MNFGIPSGQALGKEHAALVLHFEGSGAYGAGLRLGPVGALIVNEVFIGLLKANESSYHPAEMDAGATPGEFHLTADI